MNFYGGRAAPVAAVFGALLLATGPSQALEGYFQHGYGARHKALAGAGAADGTDATIAVINPAGLVHAKNEIDIAFSLFSPTREFFGYGDPGLTPMGSVDSNTMAFFVPNLAAAYRVDDSPWVDVVGITVWGNGANTNYPAMVRPVTECGGGTGMYCGGAAGIDLQQMFLTLTVAKEIAPGFSVGFGPTFARQQFRAKGLGLFAPVSNSIDAEWGAGVNAGVEWSISSNFRLGAAIASRTYMGSYEKYSGLLADRGDCDMPAYGQAGLAYDVQPDLTVMLDYQRIAYGSVACVANPAAAMLYAPFGSAAGPSFGWRDLNIFKLGIEWHHSETLTLRAGYAYNTPLFGGDNVQLDVLAPATTQHHITAGGEVRIDREWAVEFAGMYAPRNTVSGAEIIPGPGHRIDIATEQFELTLGLKYFYDSKY
jgi:long-chain fatty acid transport protein